MELQALLDAYGFTDEGWMANGQDELVCPCGEVIGLDGECPEGHRSPVMTLGFA